MHPKLTLHNNQRCVAEIEAFKKCHEAGYWARLLGECNAQKRDLDLCLRALATGESAWRKAGASGLGNLAEGCQDPMREHLEQVGWSVR